MQIPGDQNTRAEDMWRIISQRVDFRKKRVIDFGCGHGEMLWRYYIAGSEFVVGVDIELNKNNCNSLSIFYPEYFKLIEGDIEDFIGWEIYYSHMPQDDIAVCFSVIPYLNNPAQFVKWMAKTFPECLLEIQYDPEPYNIGIKDDDEMYRWLRDRGFETAVPLGKTEVKIRETFRTIWYCTKEKKPLGLK